MMSASSKRAAVMMAVAASCLAGCMAGGISPPAGRTIDTGGRKLLLRAKFPEGVVQRYESRMRFDVMGEKRAVEKIHTIIYREVKGRSGGEGVYANIYLRRRDLDRTRTETTRKGHIIKSSRPLDIQPVLSPSNNRIRDDAAQAWYYPCDDRLRFAFSAEAPFHQLYYDSVAHLFPILPKGKVSVGDEWSGSKLQVFIGGVHRQNQFPLDMSFRLSAVRSAGSRTVAVIDYDYRGRFDSSEHPDRFSADWRGTLREIHEVRGSGTAYFDIDAGVVVWKKDRADVSVTRYLQRTKTETSGDRRRTVTDTEVIPEKSKVRISQRLMAVDERLPGTAAGR